MTDNIKHIIDQLKPLRLDELELMQSAIIDLMIIAKRARDKEIADYLSDR